MDTNSRIPRIQRTSGKKTARRAQRRLEAEARNQAWQNLPISEALAILRTRPGKCEKQFRQFYEAALA